MSDADRTAGLPAGRESLSTLAVEAGVDLFGYVTARVSFGRFGCAGRTIRYEFASEAELQAFLRGRLRRRATADRRIGIAYSVARAPAAAPLLRMVGLA